MMSNRPDSAFEGAIRWSDKPVGDSYSAKTRSAMETQFESREGQVYGNQVLNTRPDPIDHRDLHYEPRLTEVPPYNYGKNVRLEDFGVRRQGSEGSCTGQALAAVIDLQNIKRFRHGAPVPRRVSARMAYESAKQYDQYPDDGLQGSSIRGAIKGFYHRGICDVRISPYHEHDYGWEFTRDIKRNAKSVVLGAYFRLRHVLNHYHSAISEAGAIMCSAIIHDGWEKAMVKANDGRIVMPKGRGKTAASADKVEVLGAHAFAIVGYDDDGFLVLNSWGRRWGGFDPVQAHLDDLEEYQKPIILNGNYYRPPKTWQEGDSLPTDSFEVNGEPGKLPGVAHWSYEDWSRHVLDAWVLRLTAPTRKDAWYSGGYSKENQDDSEVMTPRSRNVVGHFIHIKDGRLVSEPPYDNSPTSLNATADIIRGRRTRSSYRKRYQHLVFYAHGGLNTIETASARAAAMAPTFKANGVYPIFYFWRTGMGAIAKDILESQLKQIERQSDGTQNVIDHLLERRMESVGRAIWRDISSNANDCFHCQQGDNNSEQCEFCNLNGSCMRGQAWDATETLLDACRSKIAGIASKYQYPIKIHFVGHSAGALLLGSLFRRLRLAKRDSWSDFVETVTLMAPACTTKYFRANFGDIAIKLGRKRFNVLNLPEALDASMDPHFHPYGKSLLHLVSNAFETQRGVPIAGLDSYWQNEHQRDPITTEASAIAARKSKPLSDVPIWADIVKNTNYRIVDDKMTHDTVLHMGFDNSADIMNYVLAKILGKRSISKGGFDAQALSKGQF